MFQKSFMNRALFKTATRQFSTWSHLSAAPADPILGLNDAFKKDTNKDKVLLGMGAYRDNDGKPYILGCVRKAEEIILERHLDHEYAGIDGIPSFVANATKLAYGADSDIIKNDRVSGCQSISGTGSLRVGFEFLAQWYPKKGAKVIVPDPTWPTHPTIATKAGFEVQKYRYYDRENKGLDFNGMCEDLDNAENESIVVLHVCAHNPTGCDPTQEQWQQLLEICQRKQHFCAFDSAYQGFASGDLEKDAYSLNLFTQHTDRVMLFQSFAKNFGLYGERAGCVSLVTESNDQKKIVSSRIKQIARPMYSNPPIHGARIVDLILSDEQLTADWHAELKHMSGRMHQMRHGLVENLKNAGSQHDWSHVTSQIGMFAYTGLTPQQVDQVRETHSIYMTQDGRISIAGLNTHNLERIANAFHEVTK